STLVLEGLSTRDAVLSRGTDVQLCNDGVHFRYQPTGWEYFLHTRGRPEPGGKSLVLGSLEPVFESPLVAGVEAGGGAPRTAAALARLGRGSQDRPKVILLNSGRASPELDALCA